MSHHLESIDYDGVDVPANMPYSPAIRMRSGTLVFLAGVGAGAVYHSHPHRDEEFADIPTDAAGQARNAMENLKRSVEAAGGTLQDIVFVTRFFTDMMNDQDEVNRVTGEYFAGHRPTSATVGVTTLVHPSLRFEINAIAVIEDGGKEGTPA
jgi:2-iminobutanoate/2-iminopropanoate deaminase